MRLRRLRGLLAFGCAAAAAGSSALEVDAVSPAIVRVNGYDGSAVLASATGFVASAEYVLTIAHPLDGASRVTVRVPSSGAELVAEVAWSDPALNAALLRVAGLAQPALTLALGSDAQGRAVTALRTTAAETLELAVGTIGTHRAVRAARGAAETTLLEHNALVSAGDYGMPLFDECDRVIGLIVPDPDLGRRALRNGTPPSGVSFALRADDLVDALAERGVEHEVADEGCLTTAERAAQSAQEAEAARIAAEEARRRADELEQAARAAEQAQELSEREREEAQRAAEAARAEAEAEQHRAQELADAAANLEAEIERAAAELEEERRQRDEAARELEEARRQSELDAERRLRLQWAAAGAGALVLILAVAWLAYSRRKARLLRTASSQLREAERSAEEARREAAGAVKPAPFACLLDGEDSSGRRFALSIPAITLGDPRGVVLGRNPDNSTLLLDHEEISRNHTRLTVVQGVLYAEDLGTTNGTRVNGRVLEPGQRAALRSGDVLALGPIRLSVTLR